MKRRALKLKGLLTFTAILLAACGSPIQGTYSDDTGTTTYTFKPDNKVQVSAEMMGIKSEMEFDYDVDGDKVRINLPQGTVVLTRLADGSLQGMGATLRKRKS